VSRLTVLAPWIERTDWQVNELFMALGFFITLNWAARREPHAGWSRWLAAVGVFSYSLYLTHGLVLLACEGTWRALGLDATTALVAGTLLGVPAALLVARRFFEYFEKPLLNAPGSGSGLARNSPLAA
jgi:peptidoglycan/LPS O-acetylase OafA/YrhL